MLGTPPAEELHRGYVSIDVEFYQPMGGVTVLVGGQPSNGLTTVTSVATSHR